MIHDYRSNGKRSLDDVQRRITKHLTPFFAGRRMVSLTTADVRALRGQPSGGDHDHTRGLPAPSEGRHIDHHPRARSAGARGLNAEINRELTILKRIFSLALQAGKLLLQAAYSAAARGQHAHRLLRVRAVREPAGPSRRRRSVRSSSSPTSPAGGSRPRSCRSNGDRSTSRPVKSGSTPGRRRIARAACSR